jgi:hypothetical protein
MRDSQQQWLEGKKGNHNTFAAMEHPSTIRRPVTGTKMT